jgi:antitoxin YefM
MQAVTYADFSGSVDRFFDKVWNDRDPLVVARANGENIVIISADDYAGFEETDYLLSNPANAAHLARSIAQHKAGKTSEHELAEA